jgi:hypothetical protein
MDPPFLFVVFLSDLTAGPAMMVLDAHSKPFCQRRARIF